MKTTRIMLLAALLASSVAGTSHAATSVSAGIHIGSSGRASVDIGYFYDDLAPYGNWIERPSRGWVWTPRSVASDWRPYQDGHWVWTDEGWTWITDEPYGWATYHYGRWYDDPEVGWAWVPDDEWAPAWVSWQEGGDYIGWAPLPPAVDVRVSFGSYGLSYADYSFVPERYFLASRLNSYYVPRQRIDVVYRQTRNVTRYRWNDNRVYNDGIAFDRVQRVVGRSVPRYRLADLNAGERRRGARFAGNRVEVFRPQVQRVRVTAPTARPIARRAVVSTAQFQAANPSRHRVIRERQVRREEVRTTRTTRVVREAQTRPERGRVQATRPPQQERQERVRQEQQVRQERVRQQQQERVRPQRPDRPPQARVERARQQQERQERVRQEQQERARKQQERVRPQRPERPPQARVERARPQQEERVRPQRQAQQERRQQQKKERQERQHNKPPRG